MLDSKEQRSSYASINVANFQTSCSLMKKIINSQNDRVYLTERTHENLSLRTTTRRNFASQVMVWATVTINGRCPVVFIEPSVKVNATYYRKSVLEASLAPWARIHFGCRPWAFQQDLAQSHKARIVNSADANRMD